MGRDPLNQQKVLERRPYQGVGRIGQEIHVIRAVGRWPPAHPVQELRVGGEEVHGGLVSQRGGDLDEAAGAKQEREGGGVVAAVAAEEAVALEGAEETAGDDGAPALADPAAAPHAEAVREADEDLQEEVVGQYRRHECREYRGLAHAFHLHHLIKLHHRREIPQKPKIHFSPVLAKPYDNGVTQIVISFSNWVARTYIYIYR